VEKERTIKRYSATELEVRRARGESKSDLARVRAKTEMELGQDIATDPDFRDVPENWHEAAEAVMPAAKRLLSLRLDTDVIDWFREQGPGYQTRINAVLRSFVSQQGKRKERVSRR
jgi:uncharacterized protein (DUF4415 family)